MGTGVGGGKKAFVVVVVVPLAGVDVEGTNAVDDDVVVVESTSAVVVDIDFPSPLEDVPLPSVNNLLFCWDPSPDSLHNCCIVLVREASKLAKASLVIC